MAPAPRRRGVAAAWVGAATLLVGAAAWAWHRSTQTTSRHRACAPGDTAPTPLLPPPKARRGPKTSLTLAGPVLPPVWVLQRLFAVYNVHLLLPATAPYDLPAKYLADIAATGTALDTRRLLFHQTAEGKVHMARVLGGWFVDVADGVAGDDSTVPSHLERIGLSQLVGDIRTFVSGVVVVCGSSTETLDVQTAVGEQSRNFKVVVGWEGLVDVLSA